MSINIYKVSEFETTHEREQFENLSNLLKVKYDGHDDAHLLLQIQLLTTGTLMQSL